MHTREKDSLIKTHSWKPNWVVGISPLRRIYLEKGNPPAPSPHGALPLFPIKLQTKKAPFTKKSSLKQIEGKKKVTSPKKAS